MGLLTSSWEDFEKLFGLNGQTTANTTGMTPSQAKAATAGATLKNAGLLASVLGGVNSAVGGYFAAKTAQYQMNSQASAYQFESDMAALNSRSAEHDAQSILEAGKTQVGQYTMEAGQQKAAAKTSMAARGIALGEGSARDVEASMDIVKGLDVLTINSNAVRAAEAQRTQAVNDRNQSLLYSTSARNATASSNSISPLAATSNSLLNSATNIASQWQWQRKYDQMSAGGYN
jgi:hypothetical protein